METRTSSAPRCVFEHDRVVLRGSKGAAKRISEGEESVLYCVFLHILAAVDKAAAFATRKRLEYLIYGHSFG